MTRPNSPFIGSVSHEVNTYGARLIHLGLAIIKGDRIPPYNYVNPRLVSAKSALTSAELKQADNHLFRSRLGGRRDARL